MSEKEKVIDEIRQEVVRLWEKLRKLQAEYMDTRNDTSHYPRTPFSHSIALLANTSTLLRELPVVLQDKTQ